MDRTSVRRLKYLPFVQPSIPSRSKNLQSSAPLRDAKTAAKRRAKGSEKIPELLNFNLIRFFDFYLSLMFVIGLYRRIVQYRQVLSFVLAGPGRWPRLLELVKRHRMVFLGWTTMLPALLTLVLALIQIAAS